MTELDIQSIHTRLSIVEKDLIQLTQFLSKLELTMDKLSGVLSSLKETIILHDMKLANQEKIELNDLNSYKEMVNIFENLEKFLWYATGAICFCMFILPFVLKVIFKI